jgi:hypothetical protein
MKEGGRMETKSLIPRQKSPSSKPQCSKECSNDQMPNVLAKLLIRVSGFFRHYGLGICHSARRHGVWSFSGLVRPRPRPRFFKPVPDQMITIEVGFINTPCDLFGGASQRWGEEKTVCA